LDSEEARTFLLDGRDVLSPDSFPDSEKFSVHTNFLEEVFLEEVRVVRWSVHELSVLNEDILLWLLVSLQIKVGSIIFHLHWMSCSFIGRSFGLLECSTEYCALELPQERLELAPMAFLNVPENLLAELAHGDKNNNRKQAQEWGYVSENKMNDP
jgi:hypothetical protein